MDRANSLPGAETLAYGGPWLSFRAMFISHDLKRVLESAQQLAGREEEIRIAWTAQAFVALPEGLEDQDTAGRETGDQMWEMGPMEVIGDNDGIEAFRRKRPGTGFKIHRTHLEAGRIREAANVDVGGEDLMAHGVERAGMAPVARGHVQNPASRSNQVRPTQHPGGRRDRGIRRTIKTCHFLSIDSHFHARRPYIWTGLA